MKQCVVPGIFYLVAPKAHLRSSAKELTMVPGFASVLVKLSWSCLRAGTEWLPTLAEAQIRWGVASCIVLMESGGVMPAVEG